MAFATCEALLRSGTQCRSAAMTDTTFCSHYAGLVEEIGEERVRSGDHPRRRTTNVSEPLMAEVETMSWEEMKFVFALSHAQAISAFVERGDEAIRVEVQHWDPEARASIARALADVA